MRQQRKGKAPMTRAIETTGKITNKYLYFNQKSMWIQVNPSIHELDMCIQYVAMHT